MLIVESDPVNWAKKHNLTLEEDECSQCGTLVKINKPFVAKDHVGFCALECQSCGSKLKLVSFRSKAPEHAQFWNSFLGT